TERTRTKRCKTRSTAHLFFFFQAEDGIRDKLVTGVQTCALPISQLNTTNATLTDVIQHQQIVDLPLNGRNFTQLTLLTPGAAPRSEERRVGKECRCRGLCTN